MQSDLFGLHAAIEDHHWWFVGRRQILRALGERVVSPASGHLVVDVGCGTGANIAAFARDYACIGADTSSDAIAFATRRHPDVPFICGSVPDVIGDRMGEAALILLMDVLEHVPDDFLLLSTLLARSRPGAHILVTVPADERLWSEHDVSFGHYRRYDRARFRAAWDGLPVTVRLCSYFNARLYPAIRAVRTLTRCLGRSSGRRGTDFSMPPALLNRALERTFAGEAERLLRGLDGPPDAAYRHGVSLVAILRREAGTITPRRRPATIPPDRHSPR